MTQPHAAESKHMLFTTFVALCTIAAILVFIAAGSAVARLTFSPHTPHATEAHETH